MFRRTHIRLTLLNSLVFVILIAILGSVIYTYTYNRLYKEVDQALWQTARILERGEQQSEGQARDKMQGGRNNREFRFSPDPRISVLVWDENDELIASDREAILLQENGAIAKPTVFNKLQTIDKGKFSFRVIAAETTDAAAGNITVLLIRNVNSEQELLEQLVLILVIGCGIGILCAVAAGYFLAGRALVPIQKAWNKQQQFVSDASHELRTPLAVIQAKTDLLFRAPAATIEDRIMDISVISNEGRRLSKLVATLLTLARSDSNQIEIKKEPFALDGLLHELVSQYEDIASYQEKALTLDVPQPVTFTGDRERIHQLLVILLDNAMKYTLEGGRIQLGCYQTASSITVQVQDTGIGIAEEEIPRIFDRFYQSDKARTVSEESGLGLGLSIAQWIIEKHSGKVKVNSRLGEGTTFAITFPKNQK